ncbi:MAG: methyl-accepting chemotaxis protein [Candidatus Riflebacteria bacterium]|nr:methyl-accepting chemotaxis protein [Candidatus Riflebacteria bacterium]
MVAAGVHAAGSIIASRLGSSGATSRMCPTPLRPGRVLFDGIEALSGPNRRAYTAGVARGSVVGIGSDSILGFLRPTARKGGAVSMDFSNWKIGTKIAVGFVAVLLVAGAALAYLVGSMYDLAQLQHAGARRAGDALKVFACVGDMDGLYRVWADGFINDHPADARKAYAELVPKVLENVQTVKKLAATAEEEARAERYATEARLFTEAVDKELLPALDRLAAQDTRDVTGRERREQILAEIRKLDAKADLHRDEASRQLVQIARSLEREAVDADKKHDETSEQRTWVAIGVAAAGVVLALGLSWLISGAVARPIRQAAELALRLADGDLTIRIDATSRDETGELLAAFKTMVERLRQIVGEVQEAGASLNAAAAQVAATSQTLSQGTSEQAASVEQTTSSLEEMSASISQNADSSRAMEQMAIKGAADAEQSGRAVSETVEAMKSIAKKISIIEEIAYQTNLLALNAAIEAARAGEHGRGFAVVATEVRKLAERSQTAANEISELSASSVAVAERSGVLLTELVPAIRKTVDLVHDVAAASSEQASGVNQINNALAQVDQVTQRNASSSEELASTAEEMSSQAEALSHRMGFFKIGEVGRLQRRPPPAMRSPGPRVAAAEAESGPGGSTRRPGQPPHSVPDSNEFKRF